jgi:TPR repeat protein
MMFEFDLHSHDAVACWELSERRGFQHAPTRFKLAQSHLHGFNYSPDSEKALHYFQLAAAQGHDEAAAHIALFHLTGLHSPQSALEAYNLLHARAEAGCAPSMFWLSAISLSGVKFALKAAGLDKFLPSVTQDLSNDEFVATFNPDKDAERE